MNETPSTVLISALKGLILESFAISANDALKLAVTMAASGDWGTDSDPAPIFDWSFRVRAELGQKLPWKSQAERERFRLDQALSKHLKPAALSEFIQKNEAEDFRASAIQI